MNISAPFIRRPVGTTLLTIGVALAGAIAFRLLPVSPLPPVDFPTISVSANLPGADPETMATSVAAPLERQFARIAGVTEITSTSNRGSTSVTMQFDLSRDINGAARDVQGAINAARGYLPANLPSNPTYRKVNPADAPIMILSLTSNAVGTEKMYDAASTILAQKLSQVEGIGQVFVGGSSLPAVRVDLNPMALNRYGIGLDNVRRVLQATNANRPKGQLSDATRTWELTANDQIRTANQYMPLVIGYRNGSAVRLSDVADVQDSVEDLRAAGLANGKPAVLVILFRQPGANIIETVDRVRALLPQLEASMPGAVTLAVAMDRSPTIRGSLREVEKSLVISALLVILVVFLFLRTFRATIIPAVAVAVSLVGTFGLMYLCGYNLDNLSLMAMTIATGFVVDDAIVVLENVSRHMEGGMPPREAAFLGAKEVSFTVLSMSTSLVAVFTPILLMGGMIGRLFREFAVTLSMAVGVSLLVSLTTTPMMCAAILKSKFRPGSFYKAGERIFDGMHDGYDRSLSWALRHPRFMILLTAVTVAVNIYLYSTVPKGFFPQQDTGSPRRRNPRGAGRFVPVDAGEAGEGRGHRGKGSRGRHGDRLHRRRWRRRQHGQHRAAVHRPEGPGPEEDHRGRGDHPDAREAGAGAGRPDGVAAGAGHPGRREDQQRPVPVHDPGRQPEGSHGLGAARRTGDARASRAWPT